MTPVGADLPGLLRRLQAALASQDAAAAAASLQAIGPERLIQAPTLVGAAALGGVSLAHALMQAHAPAANLEQRTEALRLALAGLIEAGPNAPAMQGEQIALWLTDSFGLDGDPATLLDRLRVAFLAAHGSIEQLPEVLRQCLSLQQWAPALQALERTRAALGPALPRASYGLAGHCLHHLGRYEEANRWVEEGLGADALLLTPPPVRTEVELLRRWGGPGRKPMVSVLCHTYNHERYIDTTIQGFLSQDCGHPFEIVIHDDASTDGTAERIRDWQRRYPTLIRPILQAENQMSRGIMRPFHLAMAQARGDFVALCEGDDYWIDPLKLQRQVSFLIDNPEYSCSVHNYHLLDEATLQVRPWSSVGRDFVVTQEQMRSNQMLLWMLTMVFRNSFVELPPEHELTAFGDQLLVSYLGTQGPCAYLETMLAAVRRVNPYSSWMPLPDAEKERRRVQTWIANETMQRRLGHPQSADELQARVAASSLDPAAKEALYDKARQWQATVTA